MKRRPAVTTTNGSSATKSVHSTGSEPTPFGRRLEFVKRHNPSQATRTAGIQVYSTVLSNARAEGYDRIAKHGRIAFVFRNFDNQRR